MKKFGRMIGKKFGWVIEIYYGITSERFTRIYIMAAIPIFGFGFLNEIHTSIYSGVSGITSNTFLISRSLESMQNNIRKFVMNYQRLTMNLQIYKAFITTLEKSRLSWMG